MKILYFYQYFSTPKGSWGTRVYEFSKKWVELGHEVTVVSAIYSKSDLTTTKFVDEQEFSGIKVIVINVTIDNKKSIPKRLWSFVLYGVMASYYALTLKTDIVVASSGPITVGLPGLIAKFFRRRKLVFEVRDLWPEGAIELGIISNGFVKKIAYWFEKLCYKNSSLVVALSPGMQENIVNRFPSINVISVPNSANISLFSHKNGSDDLPEYYKNNKVAIYTGNIGRVNNSELLLKTAQVLVKMGRSDILILLVGDGQEKKELEALTKELPNFKIIDLMPKRDLVTYVQNSMVSLVPLRGTPILDTSSPNKLFESLAASVPVIQTTQGWIKALLSKEGCGLTVNADNEDDLANALIKIADNDQLRKEMGQKGKQVAINQFDKDYLAKKMVESFKNL